MLIILLRKHFPDYEIDLLGFQIDFCKNGIQTLTGGTPHSTSPVVDYRGKG